MSAWFFFHIAAISFLWMGFGHMYAADQNSCGGILVIAVIYTAVFSLGHYFGGH